jgi:hemolysin activation/secretion protein
VRTEDFQFGSLTQVTVGRTGFPINKGVKRFELDFYHSSRFKISDDHFIFLAAGYETQFYKNTVTMGRLRYYNQMFLSQTLAFNLEMRFAQQLETSQQFLLGGDSGLRGFRAREFSGDKKILINLEDRLFSGIDILSVYLGGVVFFDAGNVWTREQTVDFSDMNYSIGFGLRLGLTRGPGAPVTRIDFGYPLSRGGGFGMSIGVGQVFTAR